jgi:hypothetical protein
MAKTSTKASDEPVEPDTEPDEPDADADDALEQGARWRDVVTARRKSA